MTMIINQRRIIKQCGLVAMALVTAFILGEELPPPGNAMHRSATTCSATSLAPSSSNQTSVLYPHPDVTPFLLFGLISAIGCRYYFGQIRPRLLRETRLDASTAL